MSDRLLLPAFRKQLADRIKADIDAYCIKTYDDGPRSHLGASEIGDDCARKNWYAFRWVHHEKFSGRIVRLFQRGHLEEKRFIEYLRGIGFTVWDVDENGDQFKCAAVNGHFGGGLDGVGRAPDSYADIIQEPMLCEFKTNATGGKFNELLEKGVAYAKPQHYKQMSTYGAFHKLRFALYMCVNKNDDDLHIEIVELDWGLADTMVRKATEIIEAKTPPPKLSETDTFYVCKYCDKRDICHHNAPIEINCRSCKQAQPIDGGQWFCHTFNSVIPKDYLPKGCEKHIPVV